MAYNTIMRFEVPQFIEIEDKIFGPFTWKQFIYLLGGVGIAVVLFFTTPFIIFVIFGAPLAGLAALLAFYPVNNRPFSNFLESVVFFYKSSRVYHWRKKSNIVYRSRSNGPSSFERKYTLPQGSNLNSLSRKLEMAAIERKE